MSHNIVRVIQARQAAIAVAQQAITIADSLRESYARADAFRARMAERAAQ